MSEAITEVNRDTFWALIDQARQEPEDAGKWLKGRLTALGPEQAMTFAAFTDAYRNLSNVFGLWTAATVIDESCYSVDGFSSFQTWLISQGRDVYMAALKDPDSLADGPDYQLDKRTGTLALAGDEVYRELAGGDAIWVFGSYAQIAMREELKRGVVYGEGIGYPYDWPDVPAYLPRLCTKYYTEEQRHKCTSAAVRINTWNPDNPAVKAARRVAQKGKKGKERGAR